MLDFPNCLKNIFFQLVADTQRSVNLLESQSAETKGFLPLDFSAGMSLPPYLHSTRHSLSRARGQGDTFRVLAMQASWRPAEPGDLGKYDPDTSFSSRRSLPHQQSSPSSTRIPQEATRSQSTPLLKSQQHPLQTLHDSTWATEFKALKTHLE